MYAQSIRKFRQVQSNLDLVLERYRNSLEAMMYSSASPRRAKLRAPMPAHRFKPSVCATVVVYYQGEYGGGSVANTAQPLLLLKFDL